MTGTEILDLKLPGNDAGAETVREYLKALLTTLWEDGEGFSGKRPFGNSGWEYELYHAFGDPDDLGFDRRAADDGIFAAIEAL